MEVEDLFGSASVAHSLALASAEELSALQEQLISKRDKLYIRCPVRQKDILAKPEEIVRQLWIDRLTKQYGYPLERTTHKESAPLSRWHKTRDITGVV